MRVEMVLFRVKENVQLRFALTYKGFYGKELVN